MSTATKQQSAPAAAPAPAPAPKSLVALVEELTDPTKREAALLELSKRREEAADLAPMLWHSFGTIAALLQEIVGIYPSLSPPTLSGYASNRVCNALALLQCVASHQDTRSLFLSGELCSPLSFGCAVKMPYPRVPVQLTSPFICTLS